MTDNGHAPDVTDLADIIARTKPVRVIRYRARDIDKSNVSLYQLKLVGRTLGLEPQEMVDAGAGATWAGIDIRQCLVWTILLREEPDLSWKEAEQFRYEEVPDPTPAATSTPHGTAGSSTQPSPLAARRQKLAR